MRLIVVPAGTSVPEEAVGGVVCRDVPNPPGRPGVLLRKGQPLAREQVARLADVLPVELHVLVPDEGDVSEDVAAARLAAAVAGQGIEASPPRQGQVTLRAATRGWLRVHSQTLDRVNTREGVLVFTAYDGRPVEAGVTVGAAKSAPLLLPGRVLREVEKECELNGPVLDVRPFLPRRVALVAIDRLSRRALERARAHLSAKLAWFGATLAPFLPVASSPDAVTQALAEVRDLGVDCVLVAGVVSTDPAAPGLQGLRAAGGVVTQIGIPLDPGTACWIGRLGHIPVIGLASCELFGRITAFDLLLPRVLLGQPLDAPTLRSLAHGGLLQGGPDRFPAYES